MDKKAQLWYHLKQKGKGMLLYTIVFLIIVTITKQFVSGYERYLYFYMILACLFVAANLYQGNGSEHTMKHYWQFKEWDIDHKVNVNLPSYIEILSSLYIIVLPVLYMMVMGIM